MTGVAALAAANVTSSMCIFCNRSARNSWYSQTAGWRRVWKHNKSTEARVRTTEVSAKRSPIPSYPTGVYDHDVKGPRRRTGLEDIGTVSSICPPRPVWIDVETPSYLSSRINGKGTQTNGQEPRNSIVVGLVYYQRLSTAPVLA